MALSRDKPGERIRATLIGTAVASATAYPQDVVTARNNLDQLVANPTVYTRIDYHMGWILEIVRNN